MDWRTILAYVVFGLMSLPIAAFSALCFLFNPVGLIGIPIAVDIVDRLLFNPLALTGYWTGLFVFNLLWPLTFVPLHLLNFRILKWNGWRYLVLILCANLPIAFLVVFINSSPKDDLRDICKSRSWSPTSETLWDCVTKR